jgi:mRNA interferase YafQ
MRQPIFLKLFQKDADSAKRRGLKMEKLKQVMNRLIEGESLDARHKDHALIGNYSGHRECHIEPDWLLVYSIVDDRIVFERTGTHADLF